ncbi:peptide chain release factor N(5)-glutamine methyltransferase [Chamaesiphon sp. VAR_48_metabat_135_sub]|uniref:peptide chain release factor N(5)-glutamine methyltransferase n=1 Tax=Chamaesiphon sp. VAR_48_metabat_135_sub TaxID=2964699 RepID=UPI00286B9020|nr:peptide chain release factor N(5)-glutamine methyltransferase [Chamaesiphon sp. VAR_48_metabat_135_sub]
MNSERITGRELWDWRRWATKIGADSDVSHREVDWLLQSVANLDRLTLRLQSIDDRSSIEISMSLEQLSALWLDRVEQRKPVQYLVGKTFWRDFELVVSPDVLIPRPETESIIDIALTVSNRIQQQGIWVDLGTGSGAMAIGLAKMLPDAEIHAVDFSTAVLKIARINAARLDLLDRIHFSQGSWWSSLGHLKGKVAGMLSNPPYIPSQEVLRLQPEVVKHEPHLALDGGMDGLDAIRLLVDTAPEYLQPGGIWLIEMMAGQGTTVVELLNRQGSYTDITIIDDLAGLDRFVLAKLRDEVLNIIPSC